jgi:hypothetical protein
MGPILRPPSQKTERPWQSATYFMDMGYVPLPRCVMYGQS